MDIASLVYDVSKDLYSFYQKAKGREDDVKDIRAQLLWMGEKSVLVQEVLQRDGLAAENRSKVEDNLRRCEPAVAELRATVAKLKTEDQNNKGASVRLQARIVKLGLRTAWPFKKDTILALAEYVKTCHNALDAAISLLHLNVSVSNIEELRKTDKFIIDGSKSLEDAFSELRSSLSAQLLQISERVAEQSRLFLKQQNERKAQDIIKHLRYTELESRELRITELDDDSYAWIFTSEAQDIVEIQNLVHFLNTESGLFWVSGEAASGKSTLMKFIARSSLWQWQGHQTVTIACHFCWIAGTAAQKTQIAMLQTLLYYILVAEPDIVSDVCQNAWHFGVGSSPQSVRELRQCLQTAVRVTKRRFCLFVDGLDELEPEGDHSSVVDFFEQIAIQGRVKIILSSRPWKIFKSRHSGNNQIHMESINTKAITKYLQSTIGSLSELQDVSWPCQNGSLICEHNRMPDAGGHGDAHKLIYHVISKARGNFLWTCLITKSIISRSSAGFSMASTQKHIYETPSDLNLYFRNMIYERIGQGWRSETAMALSIAQRYKTSWISFWLLFNSLDGGLPSIESPDFALKTPYQEHDVESIRSMMQKTSNFLDTCCRDVLDTKEVHNKLMLMDRASTPTAVDFWKEVMTTTYVAFTHRTIFDYLKTQEMSELLKKHTPRHFHHVNFRAKLMIAEAKIAYKSSTTQSRIETVSSRWRVLEFALRKLCNTQPQENEDTVIGLAEEADDIALHYLLEYGHLIFEGLTNPVSGPRREHAQLIGLCVCFAKWNRYGTIDALLERWPAQACQSVDPLGYGFSQYALGYSVHVEQHIVKFNKIDTKLLKRLLAAGFDPNRPQFIMHASNHWSTPWCKFLNKLVINEEFSRKPKVGNLPKMSTPESSVSYETFATPHIQTAIEYLLEYGADLEVSMHQPSLQDLYLWRSARYGTKASEILKDARIDPLATLRAWLPMDKDSKWPRILRTYLQPTKREEIRATRQRIVDNWPKKSEREAK